MVSTGSAVSARLRRVRAWGFEMLTGKFHSHITISPTDRATAESLARLVRGKITFIDLGPTQTDFMITHHYVTGLHGLCSSADIENLLRERASLLPGVLRLKLEHEICDPRTDPACVSESIANGVYTEVHVKTDALVMGWAASSNSLNGAHFLTRRFSGVALDDIRAEVAALPCDPLEIKYEVALVDTNPALDEWWARPPAHS